MFYTATGEANTTLVLAALSHSDEESKASSTVKQHLQGSEKSSGHSTIDDDDSEPIALEHGTEAALYRKIDLRVVPALCLMFLMAFLDKVNISNARIFNLQQDLHMSNVQFSNSLVVFFVPYIVLEIPSNIVLKKLSPHIWLPVCMFMFGVVTMTQGFCTSYGGLVTARFFLGVFEAPIFQGAYYLISMWYKRNECQKRFTFFFAAIALAGAFGGLLAAAIGKMDGLRGYSGWRWIFIIEGVATAVIAASLYFIAPDFPETATWISPNERAYIKARLEADQGVSGHDRPITLHGALEVLKDWKVWVAGVMYFAMQTAGYAYAYFAPSIIQKLGFAPIATQLYSVPPWAVTFVWCMLLAVASDYFARRAVFILGSLAITLVGLCILIGTRASASVHLQYGMLFLFVMGLYGSASIIACWLALNLGGHHRRAVGSALQIALGQIGGIVAVYTFLNQLAGFAICLSFTLLAMVTCCIYYAGCWMENRRRDREMAARAVVVTREEKETLGDLALDYRYML